MNKLPQHMQHGRYTVDRTALVPERFLLVSLCPRSMYRTSTLRTDVELEESTDSALSDGQNQRDRLFKAAFILQTEVTRI